MSEKEIVFRVTGRLSFDYQIIVQAKDCEEAAYVATDIDLDKWIESGSAGEVLNVSKSYCLKRVKDKLTKAVCAAKFQIVVLFFFLLSGLMSNPAKVITFGEEVLSSRIVFPT